MTVQELINELKTLPDKTDTVFLETDTTTPLVDVLPSIVKSRVYLVGLKREQNLG